MGAQKNVNYSPFRLHSKKSSKKLLLKFISTTMRSVINRSRTMQHECLRGIKTKNRKCGQKTQLWSKIASLDKKSTPPPYIRTTTFREVVVQFRKKLGVVQLFFY